MTLLRLLGGRLGWMRVSCVPSCLGQSGAAKRGTWALERPPAASTCALACATVLRTSSSCSRSLRLLAKASRLPAGRSSLMAGSLVLGELVALPANLSPKFTNKQYSVYCDAGYILPCTSSQKTQQGTMGPGWTSRAMAVVGLSRCQLCYHRSDIDQSRVVKVADTTGHPQPGVQEEPRRRRGLD